MVYDYKCRSCQEIWEVEHSMNVSDAVEELGLACPECESTDIFKYLGNVKRVAINFVGTGWVSKDSALDAMGMPKNIQNSPHARKYLDKL